MSKKPLAYDAYQELADSYAAHIDTKPHNAYLDRPAMLGLLPDIEGKRVLDAGCGPGAYAEELLKRGAEVVSCDASERMLELARARLGPAVESGRVELLQLDLTRPLDSFSDASFEVINAPLCLDYIGDWKSVFCEFRRVLKPGGVLLYSAGHPAFDAEYFNTDNYFALEQVECTWTGFGKEISMPSYRRSLEDFVMPVIEAGFQIERLHESRPTEDFKRADPERYQSLLRRPVFLCVRAIRPV